MGAKRNFSYPTEVVEEVARRGAWNIVALGAIATFLYVVPTTAPVWWPKLLELFGTSQFTWLGKENR